MVDYQWVPVWLVLLGLITCNKSQSSNLVLLHQTSMRMLLMFVWLVSHIKFYCTCWPGMLARLYFFVEFVCQHKFLEEHLIGRWAWTHTSQILYLSVSSAGGLRLRRFYVKCCTLHETRTTLLEESTKRIVWGRLFPRRCAWQCMDIARRPTGNFCASDTCTAAMRATVGERQRLDPRSLCTLIGSSIYIKKKHLVGLARTGDGSL